MCYALQLVVDDELRDELGLCEASMSIQTEPLELSLTNPNMYTNEVKVEITKEYHPLCVS